VDLTSAFNHLVVHPEARGFLAFQFQGRTFAYRAMPFGLSLSPFFFTKLMKYPAKFIRENWKVRIVIYMDDILILHQDKEYLRISTLQIVEFLQFLGLTVNSEKSELTPKQEIVFLGWKWNLRSAEVVMTEEKRAEMIQACSFWERACSQRRIVKLKRFAGFLGSLNFLRLQFPRASLYLRSLYNTLTQTLKRTNQSWTGSLQLQISNRAEIRWWKRNVVLNAPHQLHKLTSPEATLITDASRIGWGAVLKVQEEQFVTFGRYSTEISQQSSNYREITAVLLALRFFRSILNKRKVKCLSILSDNQTTIAILTKVRAKHRLLLPARKIFSILTKWQIQIIAQYLPGKENVKADSLSRLDLSGDYQLDRNVFLSGLRSLKVSPTIDCFSTVLNHLLPVYITVIPCSTAAAVDAFSVSWGKEMPYLHPPIILIMKCLRKVVLDKIQAVIVTPDWPGQPWWPLLIQITVRKIVLGESSQILLPGLALKRMNLKLPPGRMIMSVISWELFHQVISDQP
jgi:ribonuclease HI